MKVLIEELSTGRFYKGGSEWVKFKEYARTFSSTQSAIEFCMENAMPDVRLVVCFENRAHDFHVYPFGRSELALRTRKLLENNSDLQKQQWALNAEVSQIVERLKAARGEGIAMKAGSASPKLQRQSA